MSTTQAALIEALIDLERTAILVKYQADNSGRTPYTDWASAVADLERSRAKARAALASAEAQQAPLALLVRDIAADFGVTPLQVTGALQDLGFGAHSVNTAVSADMAQTLKQHFAQQAPPAQHKAEAGAVAPQHFIVAANAVLQQLALPFPRDEIDLDAVSMLARFIAHPPAPEQPAPVKHEARRRNRFSGKWGEWRECPADMADVVKRESVEDEWEIRALYTHPTPAEHAEQPAPVMLNGLTEAETSATASVAGLSVPPAPEQPAPEVPKGYTLVPDVAPESMLVAGLNECEPLGSLINWCEGFGRREMQATWAAMLAATPTPREGE